ncbi:hypothetical protein ACFQ78_28265 [Streptomyces sp. NPDC056519]
MENYEAAPSYRPCSEMYLLSGPLADVGEQEYQRMAASLVLKQEDSL